MLTRRLAAAFLTAAFIIGWGSGVSAQDSFRPPIKNVYVFGDSLSDTGNMFALAAEADPPVEEPPSPPYFDGRFSNGPVWVETLAELLHLKNIDFDTPITLDPLANNQAVGGAFTDTRNSNDDLIPVEVNAGILSQVDNFAAAGGTIKRKDLVIVWGGANNYVFDTLAGSPPIPTDVVDDLKYAIEDLADLGGRRFLVPNLPDLGRTPLALSDVTGTLSAALTGLTGLHNAALTAMIAELREDLPDAVIVELDIKTAFDVLLAGGVFSNVTIPCLIQDAFRNRFPTGACGFVEPFDATGTLFWDLLHPTTVAHGIIALAAHAALTGAAGTLVAAALVA